RARAGGADLERAALVRWPARIGRYEVRGRLAMGGTSEVLLGAHVREDGSVDEGAIKRPLAEQALDPAAIERIRAEARLLARARHENVVRFLELVDGETPALVLERLRGRTLGAALEAGATVPWPLAVEIAAQTAAALEALHGAVDEAGPLGAVHRDVSPENLFL